MNDTATDLAVLKEVVRGHVELDAHQFGQLREDVLQIKNGQRELGEAYTNGINRVHDRIDSANKDLSSIKVSVEAAVGQTQAAITEGLNKQKIWIYSQALAVLVFILVFVVKEVVMK